MSGIYSRYSVLGVSVLFASSAAFAFSDCSREWAIQNISSKSFHLIGLGLSSHPDTKIASEEARAGALKDIAMQLQTSIQSHSEVKESQAFSNFTSNSVLISKFEHL